MADWIALLRGVNVGGKRIIAMRTLVAELEAAGFRRVRSYIQSGNLLFEADHATAADLAQRMDRLIAARFGFSVPVVVLAADELQRVASGNPFADLAAEADGKRLHVYFLEHAPAGIDRDGLAACALAGERWALQGRVFYLYTPGGFADSRLAVRIEKLLGVCATARNWKSVMALLALAAESG